MTRPLRRFPSGAVRVLIIRAQTALFYFEHAA